jgi:hypothetical protein
VAGLEGFSGVESFAGAAAGGAAFEADFDFSVVGFSSAAGFVLTSTSDSSTTISESEAGSGSFGDFPDEPCFGAADSLRLGVSAGATGPQSKPATSAKC